MGIQVFISWSGSTSHDVAEALRDWLKSVIQAVDPWTSAEDIATGARWGDDLAHQLEQCTVGIICLTPNNLTAPWLHFEAGALSKTLDNTLVCPYLFGIEPGDIVGPLTQFQAAKANKEDTKILVHSINRAQGDTALSERDLDKFFEFWWPELQQKLEAIRLGRDEQKTVQRTDREVLEEVLLRVRRMGAVTSRTVYYKERAEWLEYILRDFFHHMRTPATSTETLEDALRRAEAFLAAHDKWTRTHQTRTVIPHFPKEHFARETVIADAEESNQGDF